MRPSPRRLVPAPSPVARVRGIGDLAAVLPYLMGFTPHESLTCIAMTGPEAGRSARRVGMTARVDLAPVLAETGPLLLASVFDGVVRGGATGVIAMISSVEPVDPVVVQRLRAAAERYGLDLLDVAWDRGDVCESLLCDDPRCCPPGGHVVDRASPAAASATFAGVSVLPDRAAVEAEFEVHEPDAALDPLIAACETAALRAVVEGDGVVRTTEGATRVVALARAFDTRPAGPAPALPDAVVAQCLADLADTGVRDAVWLAVDAGEVHGQGLWLELARRAPVPYDATPMFLLGWRSWRQGDGVRAVLAAERAAATPGGYSAAGLLLDAIGACVDPRTVPPLSA